MERAAVNRKRHLRRSLITIAVLSVAVLAAAPGAVSQVAPFALGAKQHIDLKGNNILADSFDSGDPNYCTNGLYDPAKRKAHGDIASIGGIINVGNAEVMGTLYTSPTGYPTIGPYGSVGDLAWVLGGQKGIQPGHYRNDLNMDFPDVVPPYEVGVLPAGRVIGSTNYTWVLGNASYIYVEPNGATFKSGDFILVTGHATVYVTGNFIMAGGSGIVIAPGASLRLYVGGAIASLAAVNNAGNCSTFAYFGLPGNTNLSVAASSALMGTIYAPSADLYMAGGGPAHQ